MKVNCFIDPICLCRVWLSPALICDSGDIVESRIVKQFALDVKLKQTKTLKTKTNLWVSGILQNSPTLLFFVDDTQHRCILTEIVVTWCNTPQPLCACWHYHISWSLLEKMCCISSGVHKIMQKDVETHHSVSYLNILTFQLCFLMNAWALTYLKSSIHAFHCCLVMIMGDYMLAVLK